MAASNEEQIILDIKVKYADAIQGIANYKTKIDELKAAQDGLKEMRRQNIITENEYQKAMATSTEQMKVYKENTRLLSKEIQNNIKEEKHQEGSLVALRAKLSNLTRQYDELSAAERKSAKGKELQNHIKQITAELKGAEQETDRFYRNVGNYENSIKNALGLNNSFANSLMQLKSNGGGGFMQGAIDGVKSFGGALKGLMANPVFLTLAGIAGAGMAFKWFFDYNQGIAEATRLTKEFTGLAGDDLVSLRNSIQATADTFGKDYLETLQTVDALSSQFHISAQEALQVVNDGFVAGADLSGDMLAKIKDYAPSFHDAGIAADEMVAIIAQTRSGIFSDGGLDIIQTASKKIREMGKSTQSSLDAIGISSEQVKKDLESGAKSTFDVIQEVSARLRELPQDSQAVGDVLKDVFGKQAADAGIQMIETLDTMTTKMEDVKAVTGEYGEMQERQIQANEELNNVMAALFDQSEHGWETMIGNIKILIVQGITKFLKYIVQGINYLIDFYNESMLIRGAVQLLVLGIKDFWEACKLAFNLIIGALKNVAKQFVGLGKILEGVVTLSPSKIKEGFNDIVNGITNFMSGSVDAFKSFGHNAAENYLTAFQNTMNGSARKLTVPTGTADDVQMSGNASAGGGARTSASGGGKGSKNTKDAKKNARDAEKAAKAEADARKKEQEEIRKAEDLLLQLVKESQEKQRESIKQSYDRKIEDIRAKLETEKNLTAAAREAMNSQIISLEELKNRALAKLEDDFLQKRLDAETKNIDMYLSIVKKGTMTEYDLQFRKLQNEQDMALSAARNAETDEETKNANIAAIKAKYNHLFAQLEDERTKAELDAIKKRYEQKILEMQTGEEAYPELAAARMEMQMKKELLDNAHRMETESEEEFLRRRLQLQKDYNDSAKTVADQEVEINVAKAQAIGSVLSGLGEIAEEYADTNKDLAKLSKILALGEIAVNTGVALAEGIKQSQAVPFPGNIAAIATTVAAILSNIAAAIKTVKSAKFAHGGLVEGEGTDTSDSIPAMLSNGESVMTARTTRMFAPALSVMNQMGGGVSIPSRGSAEMGLEWMAKAVELGVRAMPNPVVSVEEIDRVKNRVEVIENRAAV